MAVAELCLNGDKKWFETAYRIDVGSAGCVKSDPWGIKWYRESLPTGVIAPCPHPYAANSPFCKPLAVSRWTIGIGLDAKYL